MNKLTFGKNADPDRGGASYSSAAVPTDSAPSPLADALQVLLRRRVFIASFVLIVFAICSVVIFSLPRVYMARTEIALLANQANIVDLEAVVTGIGKDDQSIQTEIRILQSRRLAQKLMDDLEARGLTNFTRQAPETSPVRQTARTIVGTVVGWISGLSDDEEAVETAGDNGMSGATDAAAAQEEDLAAIASDLRRTGLPTPSGLATDAVTADPDDAALTAFTKMFDVYRLGSSRVIAIEVQAYHPEIAVILADGLAETYIEDQLDSRFEATTRASTWLSQRIAALRTQVDTSEREVVSFMAETGVSDGQSDQLWLREIGETNQQLAVARRNLSDIQQRLAIAQAGVTGSEVDVLAQEVEASAEDTGLPSDSVEGLPEVIASRAIQQLRIDQLRLQRDASDLRQNLGQRHPRVAQVQAELNDVNAEIDREIERIVQALEVQQRVAAAEVARVEQRREELEDQLSQAQQAQVTLRALQREADADRLMLENFLTRFRETREQSEQELQVPDARIISYAGLPRNAASPPTKFLLAASLIASVGLALTLAYGMESLEAGYRMPSQIERRTGLPVLAQIPRASEKLGRGGKNLVDHLKKNPRSSFAESVRQLYITLKLEDTTAGTSVMVTSSQSAEGKSTLAAAMAVIAAQAGQKVVLVEADLRRPQLSRIMKCNATKGLANFLLGETPIEEVINATSQNNVHIIPAGKVSKDTVETFDSRAMSALMAALQDEFDLVVVDAPPVLAVADAMNISTLVRRVVYVVQWSGTQREMVDVGLRRLSLAGAYVAGIAMTMVRTSKSAMFNYGDSGVYVGDRISRYYDDA